MKPQKSTGLTGLLLGALLTGFGLLVFGGAILRETPSFWRNAGGYSVGLRELVLAGFYPAFGIFVLLLVGAGFVGGKMLRQNIRAGALLLLACAFNLLLCAAIVTIVAWNNLENILQGLPLHHHA